MSLSLAQKEYQLQKQEAMAQLCREQLSKTEAAIAEKEQELAALRDRLALDQSALEEADACVESCRQSLAVPAPTEPAAADATEAPKTEKTDSWRTSTIILCPEEEELALLRRIADGELVSPTKSVSWGKKSKHSPWADEPSRILWALRAAPERRLSFQALYARQSADPPERLQAFLRELKKQGLVTVL